MFEDREFAKYAGMLGYQIKTAAKPYQWSEGVSRGHPGLERAVNLLRGLIEFHYEMDRMLDDRQRTEAFANYYLRLYYDAILDEIEDRQACVSPHNIDELFVFERLKHFLDRQANPLTWCIEHTTRPYNRTLN